MDIQINNTVIIPRHQPNTPQYGVVYGGGLTADEAAAVRYLCTNIPMWDKSLAYVSRALIDYGDGGVSVALPDDIEKQLGAIKVKVIEDDAYLSKLTLYIASLGTSVGFVPMDDKNTLMFFNGTNMYHF